MAESVENQSLFIYFQRLVIVRFFLGYVFLVSGIIINILQVLSACFIWPFNRGLYRKINYHLATVIWSQMTFVYQWWSNSDIIVYMKPEDLEKWGNENSLWLGNHRYEVDWLLGWVMTQRLGLAGGSKIVGKQSLVLLPVIGWCWHFTESIFLKRVWSTDKAILERDIQRLVHDYPENYHFTLFLSCEGTRYTEEKRLESMIIAKEKGLPELKYHILPRTKGFSLIMKGIHKNISAIYDITVGFQTPSNPDLSKILRGQRCVAESFIRRIPVSDVSHDDEAKSAAFIQKLFQEKDKTFEYFAKHGTFEGAGNPRATSLKRKKQDLVIELLCLILVGLPSIYFFAQFLWYSSIYSKMILLTIIVAASFAVRLMIPTSKRVKDSDRVKKQE